MKKYITMAGGAAIAVSLLLPFTTAMGITVNGLKMGGAAWFYMVCGLGVIASGYLDKRKFYIAVLIIGLLIAALAMKYQSDVKALQGTVGVGLWLLFFGGLLSLAGGVMGVLAKKKYVNKVD